MKIDKQEDIIVGDFYWLKYLGEQRIGQAIDFYGEVRFMVTGFGDTVEFDSVSEIRPVIDPCTCDTDEPCPIHY